MPMLGRSSQGPLWESTSESRVKEDLDPLRNIPTDFKTTFSFPAFKIYVESVVADVKRNRKKDLTKTGWCFTRTLA